MKDEKPVHGCIDLGSSYFRLLVLSPVGNGGERGGGVAGWPDYIRDVEPGEVVEIGEELRFYRDRVKGGEYLVIESKRFIGWGELISKGWVVDDETVDAACTMVKELVDIARAFGCPSPLLVGTNPFREAKNSAIIRGRVEDAVGLRLNVLTERGEASLGFKGAATSVSEEGVVVVIDLGGTSTEVSYGEGSTMKEYVSLKLGTHRVAERLGEPIVDGFGYRRGLIYYMDELARVMDSDPVLNKVKGILSDGDVVHTVVTGGTAVSIGVIGAMLFRGADGIVRELKLSMEEFRLLRSRVRSLYSSSKELLLPVDRARRFLLLPGLILFEAILNTLDIDRMSVTPRDLRWGAVLSGGRFDKGELLY